MTNLLPPVIPEFITESKQKLALTCEAMQCSVKKSSAVLIMSKK